MDRCPRARRGGSFSARCAPRLLLEARFVRIHSNHERRREQAHFDRIAKDHGFVFVVIPSTRWFARQPIALNAPGRTVAKYDVRAPTSLEDASRAELGRETKQAVAYAAIAAALSRGKGVGPQSRFGDAMARVVDELVSLAGFSYAGIDATSFEPTF